MSPSPPSSPQLLTAERLRRWPLPQPDEGGDKEERGRVLVVGGSPEMPGPILLAATAALRAGAGKLRIAAGRGIAIPVATAVPELRVFALDETATGGIAASSAAAILRAAEGAQAVLVSPGMVDEAAVSQLLRALLPSLTSTTLILDAAALAFPADEPRALRALGGRVILTPHAGEMARLLGIDRESVQRDPMATAQRAAARFGAVVALKGAETQIAAPHGESFCNRAGNVGLATSGSGDTLAGLIAGLAARGAEPAQATAWGVYLHASAGDRLARRMGRLGFLARELLAEVPALMAELAGPETSEQSGR